ncbi:MAG TPA: hypothetical protein PLT28_05740 [Saprospiraceae bacterium]|nr:hypothetical protein [Saprospiraceae bacterium]
MATCKLCQEEKPLIKKSHIIPDFFYKESGLYNEKHQIHKIEAQEFAKSKKFGYVPTGDYEGGILCKECDNELIGRLETYGRKVLFGGLSKGEEIHCNNYHNPADGFQYSICENVDYTRFKLFLLSILWRACITKRDVFKAAAIDECDLEKIRSMLINNDAGRLNEFPIIILSYLNDDTMPRDLIFQPIKSVTPEKTMITFLMGGYVFIFNITDDYADIGDIEEVTITPANRVTIMHFLKGTAWDFILQYANLK